MKKYLALILTLVMLASVLVGCGESAKPESDDPTSQPATAPSSPSAPTTPSTEPSQEATDPSSATPPPTQVTEPSEEEPEPSEEVTDPSEPEEPESVHLHTLPWDDDNVSFYKGEEKNAYGDIFEGCFYELVSWGDTYVDDEYITMSTASFTVDGAYRYLTGTFFTRRSQSEDFTIELLIYADDELIYCSEPISRKTRSVDLAIDIGDCEVLTIAARSYDYTSSGTNPGIYLCNPMLWNEYDGELTPGAEIDPNLVSLTDLYVYSGKDNIDVGKDTDSYGNVYKGIHLDLCSWGDYVGNFDHQASTVFVNEGYRYLSGTFFTRKSQNESYEIEFLIYADDELVYSSGMINRSTKAIDFVVELGDCDLIKVMSRSTNYTSSGTNPGIILVDAFVSVEEP